MENKDENLISKLEAVLFYAGEGIEISFLAKLLEVKEKEVKDAFDELQTSLQNRGLKLIIHENTAMLVTSPEYSGLLEKLIKEERERDLGRAAIETLSIIAYKGPVNKKEIEYIRGVNCQYVLRGLLLRGLIEKKNSEADSRMVVYNVTMDTLRFLGLGKISDLPEYKKIGTELEIKKNAESEEEKPE